MNNKKEKERFKEFLQLDVTYPEGDKTCAYCKRSLLPDDPILQYEQRTETTRYVYRFCQQAHATKGWPRDEWPEE